MQRLWRSRWRSCFDCWRWIETATRIGWYFWKCCNGNHLQNGPYFCFWPCFINLADITSESIVTITNQHLYTAGNKLIKLWVQIGVHYGGVFYEFVPWNGVVSWEVDPWGHWCFSAENETHTVKFNFQLCFSNHQCSWQKSRIDFLELLVTMIPSSRSKWKWQQKILARHCVLPPQRLGSLQLARTLALVI